MPIVDDPYEFGRIAATNAISDIYAMGGEPLMAIAILGWPIDKLPAAVAAKVMEGGQATCRAANIPLAGGHSIDSPEPIFGLAVTGRVSKAHLKGNDGATEDCLLYLTKPLGIGILTTAEKRALLEDGAIKPAVEAMTTLNKIGGMASHLKGVKAMTDITGFGLIGHLSEICLASDVSAVVDFSAVPQLPGAKKYYDMGSVPGGTRKNVKMYSQHYNADVDPYAIHLLCDAQTSGGLLIAVERADAVQFEAFCSENGYDLKPIGHTTKRGETLITVKAE